MGGGGGRCRGKERGRGRGKVEEGQPTLKPRGPAQGGTRRRSAGQQGGSGKQRKKEGQQKGGTKRCRAPVRRKWFFLPGFSTNPGNAVLVTGNYSVDVVQTQDLGLVVQSGETGKAPGVAGGEAEAK